MGKKANLLIRSFYYFRNGYGIYISLPLTLVSFTTTIYYLAIQNIPLLKTIFPGFMEFAAALILTVYPVGSLAGWIHFKKAPFYEMETHIQTESNPYSQDKLAPVMVPLWEFFYEYGTKEGMNPVTLEKMRKILDNSR